MDRAERGCLERTGLSLGQVTVVTSLLLLAVWIPLRQRPGLGTIANAVIVGPVLDLGVWLIPPPHALAGQVALLVAALLGIAVATGLYVGAGWGPGPRDGLMTGLAQLGVPIAAARMAIEVTVLAAGWTLGGTVGVATALFAVGIGPLVAQALPRLIIASGPRCPRPAPA